MSKPILQLITLGWLVLLTACASTLERDVEAALSNPEQTGIRWGLVVADMAGNELLAIRPDDRFTPASNTKIITTMATYHAYDVLSAPELNPGTQVYLEPNSDDLPPNLILKGGGDPQLMDDPACETTCLAELADLVAALGLTDIQQVIGDDTFFPFERWGPGWSVEDLQFYYGTAVSALSVNDNLVWVELAPGPALGAQADMNWRSGDAYYELINDVTMVAPEADRALRFERYPGASKIRVYGELPLESAPLEFGLAIDNPAEYAALRFKRLLEARGIRVSGVGTRHRPLSRLDEVPDPDEEAFPISAPMPMPQETPTALLPASPLRESLTRISKDSENLHADIALRRLGRLSGTGSRAYGVAALEAFLEEAGLPEQSYALHGGSGMSIYNRISPRGMVQLLSFAAQQDWFEDWLADQPIGGVDGSLQRRFKGTALDGKIFAKTGTLNGANALSGMMISDSGRELLFSIIANDRPSTTRSAIPEMDAALVAIAAAY